MRLLSLTLEGFMPYRTRQSLDFRQVDLFALVGPTGSGKSALLDAITFALFGKTPRWHNETGAVKLTSQGMTRMSVSLEFRAGGKEYQVIRTAKRAVVEAQLRHLVEGEYRPMSNERRKTGDITADIERIVGMDYLTFTRTLMLPQGQFDRLLKPGKPAERKDLLIQLAGLSVYDQLGDRLALRMRVLEGDLRQVKGEMGLFESLRPERRDELEAELLALQSVRTERQQQFDGVTRQLEQLRADWRHWQLLQDARAALAPLQARAAEMHELAARLERSRQMEGQEARLQHLDQLRHEGKSLEAQLAAGQAERGRLEEQLCALQEQLEQAIASAEAIPGLQERLQELAELKESARTLADLRSEEQGLALEPLEKERREFERQWNHCDLEFQRVEHELTALGELPADLTPFQEALERARECERQLAHKAEVERELGAAQHEVREAEARFEGLDRQLGELREKHRQARQQLEAIEAERAALVLRGKLQPHCPCPVCLQTVRELPLDLQLEDADLEEARQIEELSRRQVDELAAVHQDQRIGCATARQREERAQHSLASFPADLEQPAEGSPSLQQSLQIMQQKQQQQSSLHKQLQKLEADRRLLEVQLRAAEEKLQQRRQRRQELLEKIGARAEQLQAALGSDSDPLGQVQRQSEQVRVRIQELEGARNRAEQNHREAGSSLQQKLQTLEMLGQQQQRLCQQQVQVESALATFLEQAGLGDEAELRQLLLPSQEARRLSETLEEYRQRRSQLEAAVHEHEAALQGRCPSRHELEQAEAQQSQLKEELTGLNIQTGALQKELQVLQEQLQQAREIRERLQELQRRFDLHQQLAQMTNARHLKAFVANQLLAEILRLASQELERLSGRYQLQLQNDDIQVIDNWNAGEARDVRSLSGGETFLASLSLALAMVDYLSQGSPLESLFIDEGFGTLDPETLESVTQVLEQLQEKGRLVGIITHVADLAERLPVQICVEKHQGSSRVVRPSLSSVP